MDLIDLINTRRFLGSEFMMWLWFRADCNDGLMDAGKHGTLEVVFDDALTLEAYLAETERNDFRGGAPAFSEEAKTALRHGKRCEKAKLRVIKDAREWVFTLKAESLAMSGIKIPAVLSKEDSEVFYERMYLVEEIEEILEILYHQFLKIRLGDTWHDAMLPAMRKWIASSEAAKPEDYPR